MNSQASEASPANVLDFALESFACGDDEDLFDAVGTATPERIAAVLDEYRIFASRGTLQAPPLEAGELRPYFVTDSHLPAWARGGIDMADGFETLDDVWKAVDAIKHRLLYCHSVALDDAFGHLLAMNSWAGRTDSHRERLLNYVNFLLHMGPLLRSHVLCLVSSESYVTELRAARQRGTRAERSRLAKRLDETLKGAAILQTLDFREIMQAAPDEVRREWEENLRRSADEQLLRDVNFDVGCERVGMAVGAAANAPGKLSVYLPFRYDVDLLSAFQRQAPANEAIHLPDADNWLLSKLIDIELPGIAGLPTEELVDIRTQSDEFGAWRQVLRAAIKDAQDLPDDLWGRSAAVREEIKVKLREGKAQLEASMPRSAVLKGLKKGGVAMLGGTISAAIVFLLDPTKTIGAILAGLAGTAGSSGISMLAEALEGSGGRAKRAAQAHYVAALK